MEKIETKTATLSLLESNVLLVTMKEDEEVDVSAAKENYEAAMRLTNGSKYVSLVDARLYVTITDDAKKYSANLDMYTHAIAQAVVINSLATRLLANFLIKFTQQNKGLEMKIFNDYNEAYSWLKEKLAQDKIAAKIKEAAN